MRDLRQSLRNVASEIGDLNRGYAGHLRIGVGPAVPDQLMMDSISELIREAPRLATQLVISDADQILPALRKGDLDVVINHVHPMEPVGLKWSSLYEDEYVVCCSSHHRLAARNRVSLGELSAERWALSDPGLPTQQRLRDVFRECGLLPPQVAFECRLLNPRLQAAANSDLLLYASRVAVARAIDAGVAIRILTVAELAWRRAIGVITRDEQYVHPAVVRFVDILKRVAAGISPGNRARQVGTMRRRSSANAKALNH
jgi:DNA-binding transcriptional LysR family regulator